MSMSYMVYQGSNLPSMSSPGADPGTCLAQDPAEPWAKRFFLQKTSGKTLQLSCKTNISSLQKDIVCERGTVFQQFPFFPFSTQTNSGQFQNPGRSKRNIWAREQEK